MRKKKNESGMVSSFSSSTEVDVEFDIIKELNKTLDEMGKSIDELDIHGVKDSYPYLRFLVEELEESLSGEFENLRYRRFITKKSE
ncbi:MAG: hypothetical protein PVH02_05350 [Desulfobacteraceae bacterium]|jgi:hypothetical protein